MHVEDYGPLLRSRGVLLHYVATAQSTMDYSIMAMDEGVVDSPVTRAPILERLNSPLPVWPYSLPHFPLESFESERLHFYQTCPIWYGGC